jgi:hypothetical protein
MATPKLEFLKNDAGESEGLGDAGIETFKDDPYASCGRETGQNSRDAAAGMPVRMTFDLIEVDATDFPGRDDFASAVDICSAAASDDKEREFFKQARQLLREPKIKVLRIADYSTKGLQGPPDKAGTPFHSLLKGAGVSSKESDTSGGSFGIGKNAAFAVSDLQAVFYSTIYEDVENGPTFAAQGKVRLVSHEDASGYARRATAYWGEAEGYKAVTSIDDVPSWMRRIEVGTSIFSIGFREEESWAERIAYSLLSNFFTAIETGDMEFEVDGGRLKINASTLAGLFNDPAIQAAALKAGRRDDLRFSADLHRCLVAGDAIERKLSVNGLGEVQIRILVADDLPRRVGIVRNGMLITTGLEHFGDKLERFSGSQDFVALVRPDEAASRLMKRLENPKHDSFSANRISDPLKRQDAERAMKGLHRELRRMIKEVTAVTADEEVLIDEMTDFFSDDPTEQRPPDPKADHDPERYVYTPPKIRRVRKQDRASDGGRDGGSGTEDSAESGAAGGGKGPGSGTGGSGKAGQAPPVALKELRNVMGADPGGRSRTIWFTPTATGKTSIRLDATGINSAERLNIASATVGSVSGGNLIVDLEEGVRLRVDVALDAPYDGPIEVAASLVPEAVQ